MGDKSSIEWTDATWNPTVGCDRISPGCAKCYAKSLHDRRHKAFLSGKKMAPQYAQPFEVLQMLDNRLDAPLRRRMPTTYFVNSVSDLFHEDVPDAFIDKVFAVMALARQHTFQILTKRGERMRAYMDAGEDVLPDRWAEAFSEMGIEPPLDDLARDLRRQGADMDEQESANWERAWSGIGHGPWPLPNVWLGVSVENQRFADERIPLLLQTPAAVRFISAEPLLGPIDASPWVKGSLASLRGLACDGWLPPLDWVIVGGESGARYARPFDFAWARSIVKQCQAGGVPVFVKQLGANAIDGKLTAKELVEGGAGRPRPVDQPLTEATAAELLDGYGVGVMNRQVALRDRKGGDMAEWPEDLRIREMPAVRS